VLLSLASCLGDALDVLAELELCEDELVMLWLLAMLPDEAEPLLCEPPPPELCCANRPTETNRTGATKKLESRMEHLQTDLGSRLQILVVLQISYR
jgi:hypothetical protein